MFTKLSRKQESVTDGQTSRYYYILSTLSRGDNNQELWGQQKVWITQLVTEDFYQFSSLKPLINIGST
jgi:hypothetical protein